MRMRVWLELGLRFRFGLVGFRIGLGSGFRMRCYFGTEGVFFRFPLGVLHRDGVLHLQGLRIELGSDLV